MADKQQKAIENLSEYLRKRGLYEDSVPLYEGDSLDNIILKDDELLAGAAAIARNERAVQAVIRVRILKLQRELVLSCAPEEVMVYRQAIVEIASILTDLEKYKKEYERREGARINHEGKEGGTPQSGPML